MKYFLILSLCLSQFAFAQQEKTFTYKVAKGETIDEIAKKYNISIIDIYKINPEAQNGITENTVLVIPNTQSFSYNLKKSNIPVNMPSRNHVVQTKETLYSISKQYNVSVQDIEKLNANTLKEGLKIGQTLIIPQEAVTKIGVKEPKVIKEVVTPKDEKTEGKPKTTTEVIPGRIYHLVKPQETLFSIARLYSVSVQDLDASNSELLKEGLRIGQNVLIPSKKKTLDGKPRIINGETIFHTVLAKETKYSIAKKYNISIEQLESQNPEIINGLTEGNKLAINVTKIAPKSENEELMIALAEKQVAIEKNKAKTLEIEDLQDKLTVQKQMNQKVLKVNSLKVNLNEIDETKGGSAQKLKLVLEANKNIQEILISKLDSLVITMSDDLEQLKKTDIEDLETSKKLEKESYKNIGQTNNLLFELKKDLTDNRKIYTGLMSKVQRIAFQENHEYKKKVNENLKENALDKNDVASLEDIKLIQNSQEQNDKRNEQLLIKIDSIGAEKNAELKRRISKASFYSSEAREYDDKMALAKLKRYQKNAKQTNASDQANTTVTPVSSEEIRKKLKNETLDGEKPVKIEVLKNIQDVENGYYIVAGVFTEAAPRDAFARSLTDAGELGTSFFYNINVFSYYVFTKKFKNTDQALYEYKLKEGKQWYEKMFVVQVDND
jgi:LysM repeat protein